MRRSRRRWVGALAVALVAGLTGYFVAVGIGRASDVAGPVGTVIALVALLAQLFPKPSEERTVAPPEARLTAKVRDGIQVIVGKIVHSPVGMVLVAIVAIVALGLATLVVMAVVERGAGEHADAAPGRGSASPVPSTTSASAPVPLPVSTSPTASRGGSGTPTPTRISIAPTPTRTRTPTPTPVAGSPLALYNGAEYVALLSTGPKLVGKADGPDVEIETLTVDPLGMGIAAPDAAGSCGSVQWQDVPLRFDIASRPSFCVRSRLNEVWLLKLEPTVDGPDRPRPYLATFTKLA